MFAMTLLNEAGALRNNEFELSLGEQKICPQCAKPFTARSGSGGSKQKFCSTDCRLGFHNKPSVAQRSPACDAATPLVAVTQPAEKDAPAAAPNDFDWGNDEDIVLREQQSIAIYRNMHGGLVIRQERGWDQEEDVCIIVTAENINTFIDRLTDVAGIPSFGKR
jgi:hypothetical protein